MSEQTSHGTDRDDVAQDAAAAGSTDEPAGNLTVEDDPQGTTTPRTWPVPAIPTTTASSSRCDPGRVTGGHATPPVTRSGVSADETSGRARGCARSPDRMGAAPGHAPQSG